MGLDDMIDKAKDVLGGKSESEKKIDDAADAVKDKTPDQADDLVDKAADFAKDQVDDK